MTSSATFKFFRPKGPTRIITYPADAFPAWPALSASLSSLYEIPAQSLGLTYIDDEGDAIALNTNEELQQYYSTLPQSSNDDPLRVKFGVIDLSCETGQDTTSDEDDGPAPGGEAKDSLSSSSSSDSDADIPRRGHRHGRHHRHHHQRHRHHHHGEPRLRGGRRHRHGHDHVHHRDHGPEPVPSSQDPGADEATVTSGPEEVDNETAGRPRRHRHGGPHAHGHHHHHHHGHEHDENTLTRVRRAVREAGEAREARRGLRRGGRRRHHHGHVHVEPVGA